MKERALVEGAGMAPRPFPAATVALVRGAGAAREVLMLRRPPQSVFAPDAWVFPGGRLDVGDLTFDHASLSSGPAPAEWARALAIADPSEAGAYVVAAIREAWEETGILLAAGRIECDQAEIRREALLTGRSDLAEVLREFPARLATGRLRYIGHRVTPEWLPRRFDTRFFLCEVGPDAHCVLRGDELTESRWIRPEAALRAADESSMTLLPPTTETLLRLARGEI